MKIYKDKVETNQIFDDKETRSKVKNGLPFFNLGQFSDNVRKTDNFLSTNFMILDLDNLDDH